MAPPPYKLESVRRVTLYHARLTEQERGGVTNVPRAPPCASVRRSMIRMATSLFFPGFCVCAKWWRRRLREMGGGDRVGSDRRIGSLTFIQEVSFVSFLAFLPIASDGGDVSPVQRLRRASSLSAYARCRGNVTSVRLSSLHPRSYEVWLSAYGR